MFFPPAPRHSSTSSSSPTTHPPVIASTHWLASLLRVPCYRYYYVLLISRNTPPTFGDHNNIKFNYINFLVDFNVQSAKKLTVILYLDRLLCRVIFSWTWMILKTAPCPSHHCSLSWLSLRGGSHCHSFSLNWLCDGHLPLSCCPPSLSLFLVNSPATSRFLCACLSPLFPSSLLLLFLWPPVPSHPSSLVGLHHSAAPAGSTVENPSWPPIVAQDIDDPL